MKKTLLFFVFLFAFITTVNAQFTQNFDSGTTIPSGWSVINGGDVNNWAFGAPGSGTANSGSNVAKITSNNTVAHNDYLVTPQINVVAGVNDKISFWVKSRSSLYIEHFDVKLSTVAPLSYADFTGTLMGNTAAPATWTLMTINLTPYVGQSIYIGFHAVSVDKWELYFDDIVSESLCNLAAPTISSITQPTCTANGSVTLGGLPSAGIWTLYTSRVTFGIPQETVNTTTTGTGTSTTLALVSDNYYSRSYSYYFKDANGCQSPTRYVSVNRKYYLNQWLECAYQDTNNDGIVNVGDQIMNHVLLGSGTSCDIGNGLFTLGSGDGFNQFASLGTLNFPGNSTQTFDVPYNITQQDINNGYATCSLQVQPQGVGYGFSNSILPVTTPLNTNGIRLTAFVDLNSNGIKDSSEPLFPFGDFQYTKNGMNTVTINSSNGSYLIPEWNASNSYDISFSINPMFSSYLTNATILTGITSTAGSGIVDYYFPVTYINSTGDLQVNTIPIGNTPRPGFEYKNRIAYLNSFNYAVSGTITFTKDSSVTISSVSQSGVTYDANGFTSSFTLQPYQMGYIDVTMQVDPSLPIGSILTNSSSITIPSSDNFPANNSSSLIQTVINSFDPNNKAETHGGKIALSSFTNNDYFTYTINFENLGTADAKTVKVIDNLDFRLNENSVIMTSSSHNCILEKSGSTLTWNFDKINLVPSGKGFVTFMIKPKPGYTVGTIIPNSASIYFDFNAPIATDICNTEFVSFLNTDVFAFKGLDYFPNPVKHSLSISNTSVITQVEITSVLGQRIMTLDINNLQAEIDLSTLQSGVYFVKVKAESKEKTVRIIKQ